MTVAALASTALASPGHRPLPCLALVVHSEELPFAPVDSWLVKVTLEITPQNGSSTRIDFTESPAGSDVRLIIRGTGPTPLLAADDNLPLGAPGAGGSDDGVDYVKMFKRS